MPPSKDDDLGKKQPPEKPQRRDGGGPKRKQGKQPGAPGASLAFTDTPDEHVDRFPKGRCECGQELADAGDLGVVDRYQQYEIPWVSVTVTQYDQHSVRCGCGKVHTAARPEGTRSGSVGYGPNLQAFAVYLMVVHFIPAHRCVELLESLTGATPSVGFVHGMLERVAGLLAEADKRIRALITCAYAVCCDETRCESGQENPSQARRRQRSICWWPPTSSTPNYLLGDRDLDTFKAFVLHDLSESVVVHDRYQNDDSAEFGELIHQLCCAHLGRDLDSAAEVYPDTMWPVQIADALRGLIHEANLARKQGRHAIDVDVRNPLISSSGTACWSDCPPLPATAIVLVSARPDCCWKSYVTEKPTCCASRMI